MKDEIEGLVVDSSYDGFGGNWIQETSLETSDHTTLEEFIRKFLGKKVKVTIEEIE